MGNLSVPLLVRELFEGGRAVVAPAAMPRFASVGREEDAIAEQAAFLEELFARSSPEIISRFPLPEGARLEEIDVVLAQDDAPGRAVCEVPITFPCIFIPAGKSAWVMVPGLDYTFFTGEGEDPKEAIRSEVRRLVASQEMGAWEIADLLPGRAHRVEIAEVPLPRRDQAFADRAASLRKAITDHARRTRAVEILSAVATALHVEAKGWRDPPLVARDAERSMIRSLLGGSERLGVALVGAENTGKTALIRAFVKEREAALVYATSGAQLVAGMSSLGQWQEQLQKVMEAAETLDAVLYFESLEDLLAERVEGGVDLAGSMRPWLDAGRVRLLGELRPDRIDALEAAHPGFFACLSRVRVDPLSAEDTARALRVRVAHDRDTEPGKPRVADEALAPILDLAQRYLPYAAFPGKAIRLYQDMRAAREKDRTRAGDPVTLGREDVFTTFSAQTGIPAFLLRDDRALHVGDVAAALEKRVIGQEPAVRALAETISVIKAGLQPSGKPLATFLFVGPTGVGKTELARALAELLFGSEARMARFDMSEFMSADAAERLIRGTDRADGLLTRAAREQPFSVLLLDEIEKAHPAVFDLLLQVAGEGRLTDARGRTAYFHNALLVMTSNLGSTDKRARTGFGAAPAEDLAHYERLVASAFRPEFVNRLDRIVAFRTLSRDEVHRIARIAIDRVRRRRGFEEAGSALVPSDATVARLAADGYSEAYGARALRRHVEERLVAPAARLLAKVGGGADLYVTVDDEPGEAREGVVIDGFEERGYRFEARRKRGARGARSISGYEETANVRRQIDKWMRLSPVQRVVDRVDFLIAELALADEARDKRPDRRYAHEIGELSAEMHRLNGLLTDARAAQEEAWIAEEVAMASLFEGHDASPYRRDAAAALARIRKVLPHLLVALEPRRNEVALMIEEIDQGAFDVWLGPLARSLAARGLTAQIHTDGTPRPATQGWPADRRWGPPLDADALLAAMGARDRSFRSVVFRCRGPDAGPLFALEAGLHRMILRARDAEAPDDESRKHVHVRLIGFFAGIPAKLWDHKLFAPPQRASSGARKKGPVARELDFDAGAVHIAGHKATLRMDPAGYWPRHDAVALEHLLLFEKPGGPSRDEAFSADDFVAALRLEDEE